MAQSSLIDFELQNNIALRGLPLNVISYRDKKRLQV